MLRDKLKEDAARITGPLGKEDLTLLQTLPSISRIHRRIRWNSERDIKTFKYANYNLKIAVLQQVSSALDWANVNVVEIKQSFSIRNSLPVMF